MYKKTIKYTDYNGVDRTEDFYFNLSKAEVAEKELVHAGGYGEYLKRIINAGNAETIVGVFKSLVLESYGEKSEDGRRFVKSQEMRDAFSQTEAYSELFIELATDHNAAIDFIVGIMPNVEGTSKAELKKSIEDNQEKFLENPTLALETSEKKDA